MPCLTHDQNAALNHLMREHMGPTADDVGEADVLWVADGQRAGDRQFDSLDRLDFIMAIEDHFHIEIPDAIAEKITTKAELRDQLAILLVARDALAR